MAQTTNAFTTYSPFFSSGLLAAYGSRPKPARRQTFSSDISEPWDDSTDSDSPSRPSSPIPLPDDSVMDVDVAGLLSGVANNMRRSVTPTPRSEEDDEQTTPVPSPQSMKVVAASPQAQSSSQGDSSRPRLRKRRSSLTQAASPMAGIRSPTRSAGNAFHLQMQIPNPSRARSGSVGGEAMGLYGSLSGMGMGMGMATQGTSLFGRMRSGSCSSMNPLTGTAAAPNVSRARRFGRRIMTLPIPAPAPPPTAPLPALPPCPMENAGAHQRLRLANMNSANIPSGTTSTTYKPPALTSARGRGMSVSNSGLGGQEHRIDEEMKEN